ncbi:MAG: zinc ribbon domain-containing protein [Candidatus Saccharicenans sp.]|jgi:putative FmdB family regulatory protein|nr:zinc ribbon domain-containing protein [Candidatus Saccharicenans sp.]MDH7493231.1 zinc ribbon domain-containing protein [Candidatus Saccharicenans sp.]
MPLYEYRCQQCHRRFEILQKINENSLETCPQCGGTLCRLISSPAIQFKGSGWYITDYAHKNAPASGNGQNGQHRSKKEKEPEGKPAEEKGKAVSGK